MKPAIFRWVPRVAAFGLAAFLSLFAMDVFGEGLGIGGTIVALMIHLIPTWLVLVALAVAWRYEVIGAVLFFLLGLAYVVMSGGRFPVSTILLIAGPPVVIGLLFIVSSRIARHRPMGA